MKRNWAFKRKPVLRSFPIQNLTVSKAFAEAADKAKEVVRVLSGTPRVVHLVWQSHPTHFTLILLGNFFLGLMPLGQMWITKLIIDKLTASLSNPSPMQPFALPWGSMMLPANTAEYVPLLALMALIDLVTSAISPTLRLAQHQLGDCLSRDIKVRIMNKVNSQPDITMFENPKFHDLLARAEDESSYRPLQMLMYLTDMCQTIVGVLSMIAVLMAFQPVLTSIVLMLSLPQLFIQFRNHYESWNIQSSEVPEVRRMRYYSHIVTNNRDAKEIRLFGLGEFFLKLYKEKFAEFQERHSKMRVVHWRRNMILSILSAVAYAGSYAFIALSALAGAITLGSLTLYAGAISSISGYLYSLIWSVAMLYEGNLFVNHLFEFLDLPQAMNLPAPQEAQVIKAPLKEGIEFKNVQFQYPDSERMVLTDLTFTMKAGQTVALVGENGAGKTTLVKLLARLYDPTAGEITADGINLKNCDLPAWRNLIAVTFQDFCRYHMTAQENIGIGELNQLSDSEAVAAAARRGGADSVIERLPDGYNTTLGRYFRSEDQGAELSGGEWQKVALSRAFMRSRNGSGNKDGERDTTNGGDDNSGGCDTTTIGGDSNGEGGKGSKKTSCANGKNNEVEADDQRYFNDAQVLILDEPTAALDAQAEHDIYMRFKELTAGKTTLLISHRFSTVKMAELILLLEEGTIKEQGSHEELMVLNGTYARLYNMQADRYR